MNEDKIHCICLYEIQNNLPRTKFCLIPCKKAKSFRKDFSYWIREQSKLGLPLDRESPNEKFNKYMSKGILNTNKNTNAEQSELFKEKIISDLNKEYESTFTLHERGLIHYNSWLQQKYAALLLLQQQDAIKSTLEEDYTPQVGDLFEWNGEHFWCIEAGKVSGVVNPINETFCLRGFFWNYDGIQSKFIRKATKKELESLGLKKD